MNSDDNKTFNGFMKQKRNKYKKRKTVQIMYLINIILKLVVIIKFLYCY